MFDKTKEVCQSPEQEHAAGPRSPLRGSLGPWQVLMLTFYNPETQNEISAKIPSQEFSM